MKLLTIRANYKLYQKQNNLFPIKQSVVKVNNYNNCQIKATYAWKQLLERYRKEET